LISTQTLRAPPGADSLVPSSSKHDI